MTAVCSIMQKELYVISVMYFYFHVNKCTTIVYFFKESLSTPLFYHERGQRNNIIMVSVNHLTQVDCSVIFYALSRYINQLIYLCINIDCKQLSCFVLLFPLDILTTCHLHLVCSPQLRYNMDLPGVYLLQTFLRQLITRPWRGF